MRLEKLLVFSEDIDTLIKDIVNYQIAILSLSFNDINLSLSILNSINTKSVYMEMATILKA